MFPPLEAIRPREEDGLVGVGGDLAPETLIEAYRKGIFPWDGRFPYPWYSPDPRCVLVPSQFVTSHSLRKLARQGRYTVRFDTAFREVMEAAAQTPRKGQAGSWISRRMVDAYERLHHMGIAHSVEVWNAEGNLVGGLYGLAMGRIFFGESMFAHERDASKLALHVLCRRLDTAGFQLVDCQQDTPHLRSLGATTLPRAEFLSRLAKALDAPDAWPGVVSSDVALARTPLTEG